MTQHTKGPWEVEIDKTKGNWTWCIRADNGVIKNIGTQVAILNPHAGGEKMEVEANARLIAAAPDMLEALEIAIEQGEFQPKVRDILVNTINKAKGVI